MAPSTRPVIERFWEKVHKTDDCWLWTASISPKGYAHFGRAGGSPRAHKWYWEYLNGPVQQGMCLDHLCRVRHCVNPDHLEVVTWRENLMRGRTHAAENIAKTHCPQGHEYTPENTYLQRNGGRRCRICKSRHEVARVRRRRAERMAA